MSPRIAVDAGPAVRSAPTGTDIYARELLVRLPELRPQFDWTFYASEPGRDFGQDVTVLPFPVLRTQVRLPLALAAGRPDLFFSPAHQLPAICPSPALTVFHGLEFRRLPQAYTAFQRLALQGALYLAKRHCRFIITVSQASRRDLVELGGLDPARVVVVYPGPGDASDGDRQAEDEVAMLAALRVKAPFALHVGRVERRKNQLAALRAVARVPGLSLVSVGPVADPALSAELSRAGQWRHFDWVPVDVRDALYRQALALVFPSLCEGFGLPILEAMRLGTPVVTVPVSSLPEAGGEAALYAGGPDDVPGLARHLQLLLEDPELRRRCSEAGRRQAARFSWDRCATEVAECIDRSL